MRVWRWLKNKKRREQQTNDMSQVPDQIMEEHKDEKISRRLKNTIQYVENLLGPNDDFVIRRFDVLGQHSAAMLYISNMVDQAIINSDILKPLMQGPPHLEGQNIETHQLKEILLKDCLYHSEGKLENILNNIVEAVLSGETVVVIEGMDYAFRISSRKIEKRSIEQPLTEQVIRGAREGFIEQLGTNLALMRYRLQTPNFRVKSIKIGRQIKSKVAICYLEGNVNPELVDEVMNRLSVIDIDGILDSGYIEQFIEDHNFSPFPQVQFTERPDKAIASILEGRVLIMVDGSPLGLIVPAVFSQFYQTMDDYSERFLMGSLVRLVRLVALVFSLFFSSLYVSVISFNPELIPTEFAVAVAGGRAGVPFPSVIEVLVMEISMEVLREATLRLPQQVGGALSIVGVLVVGQAAVSAGFASPITVVVIALTTIGSFATPAYNAAIALRMLRFPLIILAGVFGLYGVMIGMILIFNHMLSLRSFGVPYMSPIVPGDFQGMKDTVMRAPLWWMPKRPGQLHPPNKYRLGSDTEQIKEPPHNTLDPLKVGNERWDSSDGASSTDHRDPGRRDSD